MLGRAHEVERLVENIHATTESEHRIVFVCSPDDGEVRQAVHGIADMLVATWQPDRADYAKKINRAFELTTGPWFFAGASDITFNYHWDDHALRVAYGTGAGVIGTNDMASAYVRAGKSATHILIRRSYIEEYGGTIDGTGTVYCELYDHQYVDNELVETAKARGQWAFAPHSIVRHAHPHWQTAEMDATYQKALRNTVQDRALHGQRMKKVRVYAQNERRRKLRYNRA